MKLLLNYKAKDYSELDQKRPCTFAYAVLRDGVAKVQHQPVLCRDFLNDTLAWKAKDIKKGRIYGYDFNGIIDKEFTRLVIFDYGNLRRNIEALNKVEHDLGLSQTVVATVDGPESCKPAVMTVGDKFWMTTSVHMSFYTTILRGLTYPQDITDIANIPVESWMKDTHQYIPFLPEILLDMPFIRVAGARDLRVDEQETMHNFNGWSSASDYNRFKFNIYGEYIRGKLPKA